MERGCDPSYEDARRLSETFARVFPVYHEASDQIKEVIREMCEVIGAPETDTHDHDAAMATLVEALFPGT